MEQRYETHVDYKGFKLIQTTNGLEDRRGNNLGNIVTIPESHKKSHLAFFVKGGWKAHTVTFVPVEAK